MSGRDYNLKMPLNLSPHQGLASSHWYWGAVAAPTSGTVGLSIVPVGFLVKLLFTLTLARIVVTDAGAGGSYGALKLFDFNEMGLSFLGCRQKYTSNVEGAALTTAAGDAVFAIGVGTTAIVAAADGVLAAANRDVGGSTAITNTGGTGAATSMTGIAAAGAAVNGSVTPADLYLNWSGTAVTIDANSYIDMTGTIEVLAMSLGV